jgi:FkbM family methyltransferase
MHLKRLKILSRLKTTLIHGLLGRPMAIHKQNNSVFRVYKEQELGLFTKYFSRYSVSSRWLKRLYKIQGPLFGEAGVIKAFTTSANVVFDVGANVGDWSKAVLQHSPEAEVHLFEPIYQNIQFLQKDLDKSIKKGKVVVNHCALGSKEESRSFFHYEDANTWSTFYRRFDIEKRESLSKPLCVPTSVTTIDSYCQQSDINRINFMKIDVEGAELDVLLGAKTLLKNGRIDYLQFEYGRTYLDAGITLKQVFEYLSDMHYALFKILPIGLVHLEQFSPQYEDFEYSNFLAVNERFLSKILGNPPQMLDLHKLCVQYAITPQGVIHVGAHQGHEIETYQHMGIKNIFLIEANPVVFEQLQGKIAKMPDVQAINCAVSDQNGSAILHVTSMDQSSSLLPLKLHQEWFPEIKEIAQITVPSRTLDSLLEGLNLSPINYNILNLDIQGAELLALKGATNLLSHIQAINTEVNYEELYAGCAMIDDLDNFLNGYGFERVATTTPYHPAWGDAFYVKITSGQVVS